ncbi:hypothetical protein P152DRAFT_472856 [Eremomyces bilateralis CBS 781.70]|uniref:Uncharacterized protein n=1 Tax=Eremomyces bilateralis CBS 781.70 TaxID=1392243 RepID=A0A6G1G841_9PEZI|nr:uncharacterized protein P152DRAFT_472856 [Eremomyces bilateralis CBS 781.70]KAF1814091.1 hypothetical protein P152DRAFT_472856 [Eremomyces bilateralis CBS 781.70]
MLDQSQRVVPTRNFVVYRASLDPADPYDACAPLEFYPERDSDELFEALREAFPHVRTHKERVRDAVIEYLLMEKEELRKQEDTTMPSASNFDFAMFPTPTDSFTEAGPSNPLGSMDIFPQSSNMIPSLSADGFELDLSLTSPSDSFLSSPDSFLTFTTPDMTPLMSAPFDSFPSDDASRSVSQASSVAGPSASATPAMEQLTTVWSISSEPQPKRRSRRAMTEDEKKAYRKKRVVGACAECRRKRRKCQHTGVEAQYAKVATNDQIPIRYKVRQPDKPQSVRLDRSSPGMVSDRLVSSAGLANLPSSDINEPWQAIPFKSEGDLERHYEDLYLTPMSTSSEESANQVLQDEFGLKQNAINMSHKAPGAIVMRNQLSRNPFPLPTDDSSSLDPRGLSPGFVRPPAATSISEHSSPGLGSSFTDLSFSLSGDLLHTSSLRPTASQGITGLGESVGLSSSSSSQFTDENVRRRPRLSFPATDGLGDAARTAHVSRQSTAGLTDSVWPSSSLMRQLTSDNVRRLPLASGTPDVHQDSVRGVPVSRRVMAAISLPTPSAPSAARESKGVSAIAGLPLSASPGVTAPSPSPTTSVSSNGGLISTPSSVAIRRFKNPSPPLPVLSSPVATAVSGSADKRAATTQTVASLAHSGVMGDLVSAAKIYFAVMGALCVLCNIMSQQNAQARKTARMPIDSVCRAVRVRSGRMFWGSMHGPIAVV